MTYEDMLRRLGVSPNGVKTEQRDRLLTDGFVKLENHVASERLDALGAAVDRLAAEEGDAAGAELDLERGAPRLCNLMTKDPLFREAAVDPDVVGLASAAIGAPIKLHGYNERDALQGQGHQALHADWGPREADEPFRIVNTLWFIDDVYADNGATRLVPGSHRLPGAVGDHLDDRSATHPDEVLATGPRGTVYLFIAHTWHGGTRNVSGRRRRILHISYVDRRFPQQLDQQSFMAPDVAASLNPEVRYLVDVA
jgi:ectoine hydroxylase-related dioxygenase (phytanoyl-CoA dioxygenase family)